MPMLARLVSFVAAAGTLDSSLAVRPAKDFDLTAGSVDTAVFAEERDDLDIPLHSLFIAPGRDSIFILKDEALASEAQQLGHPLGDGDPSLQYSDGTVHLAEDTAQECDYGVTLTESSCKTVGLRVLNALAIAPGRIEMIASQADDAPPGCSLMTGVDWAITYNTNKEGKNSAKKYSLLCSGAKTVVHAIKEGKSECDFGKAITKVTECLEGVNMVHKDLVSSARAQTSVNVGKWPDLPSGCSLHLGSSHMHMPITSCNWQCYLDRYPDLQQDSHIGPTNIVAAEEHYKTKGQSEGRDCSCNGWFNNEPEGKNEGDYIAICTGTTVPL